MFGFFKKKQEQREAKAAQSNAFKQVIADFEQGRGNPIEGALVIHRTENNKESLVRFLVTFGGNEVWILTKKDPAVIQGDDGLPYVVIFTSKDRAEHTRTDWNLPNQPEIIHPLELIFTLGESVGMVLNPNDPHLEWGFPPAQVSQLRALFESVSKFEVGSIYSIKSDDTYRAAKILNVDEGGVHLRIYANQWSSRPSAIDPAILSLENEGPSTIRAVGHMPIRRGGFLAMVPVQAGTAAVADEELDGYRIWEENKGGYF